MDKKSIKEILIAVTLISGSIAIAFLLWSKPNPVEETEYVEVLRATRTINIGDQLLFNENVEKWVKGAEGVPDAAIVDEDGLDEMIAIEKIKPGNIVLREHLVGKDLMPSRRMPKGNVFELVFSSAWGVSDLQAGDRVTLVGGIEVDGSQASRIEFENVEVWQVQDKELIDGGLILLLIDDNRWKAVLKLQYSNGVFWIEVDN